MCIFKKRSDFQKKFQKNSKKNPKKFQKNKKNFQKFSKIQEYSVKNVVRFMFRRNHENKNSKISISDLAMTKCCFVQIMMAY